MIEKSVLQVVLVAVAMVLQMLHLHHLDPVQVVVAEVFHLDLLGPFVVVLCHDVQGCRANLRATGRTIVNLRITFHFKLSAIQSKIAD